MDEKTISLQQILEQLVVNIDKELIILIEMMTKISEADIGTNKKAMLFGYSKSALCSVYSICKDLHLETYVSLSGLGNAHKKIISEISILFEKEDTKSKMCLAEDKEFRDFLKQCDNRITDEYIDKYIKS